MADIDVHVANQIAGRLVKTENKHVFSYHQDAPEALSLTMPLRTESYAYQAGLHPVFQMNLPEGHLRQAIERATAKQYGSDDLTMLAILGANQIGRMAYTLAGKPLNKKNDSLLDLQALLDSDHGETVLNILTLELKYEFS